MADLSARNRGQLLLVTGFAIAVAIVALVLLLNTAIYTENLATRTVDTGAEDALAYRDTVEDDLWTVIGGANENDTLDRTERVREVDRRVDRFGGMVAHRHRLDGAAPGIEDRTYHNGTRLTQTDTDRELRSASGARNWTLVSTARHARTFDLNVTDTDVSPRSEAFQMAVEGAAGDEWRLYVYDDGGGATVAVENETGVSEVCSGQFSGPPRMDLIDGTIDGADCAPLSFVSDVDEPYADVTIRHGNRSTGTYELTVNETVAPGGDFNAYDPANPQPYAIPIVYSMDADVVYQSADLTYRARIHSEPEPRSPGDGRLRFARDVGDEIRTSGDESSDSDVIEFRIENTADESITVEGFAVDATDIDPGMTIDDGNAVEFDIQRASQIGEANRAGSFTADGTRYDFVDDSDEGSGGQDAILDADDDDAEVDIRRLSTPVGRMVITDSEAEADMTITLVLSDGSEEVFYLDER